jgi:hypothetical protein
MKNAQNTLLGCIEQSENSSLTLRWRRNQEMIRGNQLLYVDERANKVYVLREGMNIPGIGTITGVLNHPIDPHIITIVKGAKAKALTNPIMLEVRPATSEDDDKDAAKVCSYLLKYYQDALSLDRQSDGISIREEVVDWLFPAGVGFAKTWWDPELGDNVLLDGVPAINPNTGKPVKLGDINCKCVAPQAMMIPSGVSKMDNSLPWIGEKVAMPIKDIKNRWGVEVPEEENLEDINQLRTINALGEVGNKKLKGHALVYEIYFPPSEDYPHGRLIIGTKERIFVDSVWDKKLMAVYSDTDWHPYTYFPYIRNAGDFWPRSIVDYLFDLQVQLNKLWKKIIDSKKNTTGWFLEQEGTDWSKSKFTRDTGGIPRVIYRAGLNPPQYISPPMINQDLMGEIQHTIQRMNDISSFYEVTRGNADPSVTSGKQAELLQQASQTQAGPLLDSQVAGFINIGKRILHLCAVHFEDEGRSLRIVGNDNEGINFDITPDRIQSDDVILAGGNAFYLTPDAKRQEIQSLAEKGLLGDIVNDPIAKRKFFDMLELGDIEELYDSYLQDIDFTRWENKLFKKGIVQETDPSILQQIELQEQQMFLQWQNDVSTFDERFNKWKMDSEEFKRGYGEYQAIKATTMDKQPDIPPDMILPPHPGSEPMQPSPEPPPPLPRWRRARDGENHDICIEEHNSFRKTIEYEKLCAQMPELRQALQFHIDDHLQKKALEMAKVQQVMSSVQQPPQ